MSASSAECTAGAVSDVSGSVTMAGDGAAEIGKVGVYRMFEKNIPLNCQG